MAELDIDAAADRIVELLKANQYTEAFRELERQREQQPQAVQEALDRMVTHRAAGELEALRGRSLYPNDPDAASMTALADETLGRLDRAGGPPRMPSESEMDALTPTQTYDVYASIVETRGNDAAREDLANGRRVILGMRDENSTVDSADATDMSRRATDDPSTDIDESKRGTGVYNDRVIVLGERNPENGEGPVVEAFDRATTEPTAQYDVRSRGGEREEPYTDVEFRRELDQEDANDDGVRDLGRLAEGTYEMWHDPSRGHWNPRDGDGGFDLRPTQDAVDANPDGVQRDTNGDGRFTAADPQGEQPLNDTFKIHYGSNGNTDSAGCQTIRGTDYYDFMDAIRADPEQDRWQYVLTSTTSGEARTNASELAPETSPRPQPRPDDLNIPAPESSAPETSIRPQPRPSDGDAALGLPDDPLMRQIREAFDRSGAGQGMSADQRDNTLAVAYRAFAPTVDHVGVYNGQLVGTRAPHGLGTEPMDNIPVSIAGAKDVSARDTLAAAQREQEARFVPVARAEDEQRSMGARAA